MTFKDSLVKKANQELSNLNIDQYIEEIKMKMQEVAAHRSFVINLVQVRPGRQYCYGNGSNEYTIIIPKLIPPAQYRQLFVEKMRQLGFDEIELLDYTFYDDGQIFAIKIKW